LGVGADTPATSNASQPDAQIIFDEFGRSCSAFRTRFFFDSFFAQGSSSDSKTVG